MEKEVSDNYDVCLQEQKKAQDVYEKLKKRCEDIRKKQNIPYVPVSEAEKTEITKCKAFIDASKKVKDNEKFTNPITEKSITKGLRTYTETRKKCEQIILSREGPSKEQPEEEKAKTKSKKSPTKAQEKQKDEEFITKCEELKKNYKKAKDKGEDKIINPFTDKVISIEKAAFKKYSKDCDLAPVEQKKEKKSVPSTRKQKEAVEKPEEPIIVATSPKKTTPKKSPKKVQKESPKKSPKKKSPKKREECDIGCDLPKIKERLEKSTPSPKKKGKEEEIEIEAEEAAKEIRKRAEKAKEKKEEEMIEAERRRASAEKKQEQERRKASVERKEREEERRKASAEKRERQRQEEIQKGKEEEEEIVTKTRTTADKNKCKEIVDKIESDELFDPNLINNVMKNEDVNLTVCSVIAITKVIQIIITLMIEDLAFNNFNLEKLLEQELYDDLLTNLQSTKYNPKDRKLMIKNVSEFKIEDILDPLIDERKVTLEDPVYEEIVISSRNFIYLMVKFFIKKIKEMNKYVGVEEIEEIADEIFSLNNDMKNEINEVVSKYLSSS